MESKFVCIVLLAILGCVAGARPPSRAGGWYCAGKSVIIIVIKMCYTPVFSVTLVCFVAGGHVQCKQVHMHFRTLGEGK